jgi:PAS domain S-box-containing protein
MKATLNSILLLLIVAGMSLLHPPAAEARRTVRAGVYNFKPLVYTEADGSSRGLYVEILNHVAKKEEWDVQYVPGTWQEGLDRLKSDQIDLLLCIGYTEERKKFLDFPKEYLLLDWGLVYRAKGSTITNIMDLEGKTIGMLKGSVYSGGFLELIKQFHVTAKAVEMNQVSDVFKAVDTGKVDAGVTGNIPGILNETGHNVERTPIIFTPVKLGYGVTGGRNADLIAALDRNIAALKADKTSIYYHELENLLGKKDAGVPKHLYWILAGILCTLAVCFSFVVILRRQVQKKTVELKSSNRELTEQGALLTSIINGTTDAVFIKDNAGRYIVVNDETVRLFNLTRSEIIGHDDTRFFPPEEARMLIASDKAIMDGGRVVTQKEYVTTLDTPRTYLATKGPVYDEDDNLSGMFGISRDITDIIQAEDSLRASKEEYRLLVDNLASGVVVHAPDSSIIFANPMALTLLGLTKEQIRGKSAIDPEWCFIRENGTTMPLEEFPVNQVISTGTPLSDFVVGVRRPDLVDQVWVLCHAYPVSDGEGLLQQVVVTFSDISKRKRAEDALNKRLVALTQPVESAAVSFDVLFNLDELQRLQDGFARATGVASIITYPDGTPLTAPSNFTRLCSDIIRTTEKGCSNCFKSDAALGRFNPDGPNIQPCLSGGLWDAGAGITVGGQHIANWLIGQVRDETQTEESMAAYAREIGADEPSFIEAFREVPAMSRRHFEQVASTLFTLANQLSITAYQNIQQARFINERQQAELELQENRKQYHNLVEGTPDLITRVDTEGRLIFVNHTALKIYGLPPEECIGQMAFEFIHPDDRESTIAAFSSWIQSGEEIFTHENRQVSIGSPDHHMMWTIRAERDESGALTGFASTARDITESKHTQEEKDKLEAQLQQAQKMESVGRLAGGVAHDFNNMLGVILGHAELGLMHLDPTHPVCANLKEISKTAERSADLTRQLLAFARNQTVKPKIIDLNETVTATLKMLQRMIGEDIHLTWQPAPHRCQVKVDPSQIDQILANLCVNARDAIADIGRITIETANCTIDAEYCSTNLEATPSEYVRICVSDNGDGMDKETQSHIFEPFYTTKELGKGTGLGLATVYGAVKQNNGFINIYSEPGNGTTFSIYLPRYEGEARQMQPDAPPLPVPHGDETILLVEDEPAILNMAALMLRKQGYTVLTADTVARALAVAGEHTGKIHLLMTDVIMPEMNGRDLSKTVITLHPGIKCLFMSGYTADVIARHGVLDEGVSFIQKPFSLPNMAAKVRELLDGGIVV